MATFGKCPLRLLLYALVAVYLISDIFIFKGPLRQKIDLANPHSEAAIAQAKSKGIIARVAGRTLSSSQLDRAVSERLWLEGKTPETTAAADLETTRKAALEDLIFHELIRIQVDATTPPIPVGDGEVRERFSRLLGRFGTQDALDSAMKAQGVPNEKSLRNRLRAEIQTEKWIEQEIASRIKVTDQEAEDWFKKHQKELEIPERLEARHIFLPTLDHPPEEAKQALEKGLLALTEKKKDFLTLAKEISQDPATKDNGGALGWMTRDRLPADFSAPVFDLALNQPTLIRSRLGWHLVEVTSRKDASLPDFSQIRTEVISGLEAIKRKQAVADKRVALRKAASAEIEMLTEN
jgi:parvulin-like peptidyl-prolyl isomerase